MTLYQVRLRVQQFLTLVGQYMSELHIQKLNSIVNYLEVGRWLKANNFSSYPRYSDRWLMYDALAGPIKLEKVLYLEFGVYEGYTLRRWAKLLENADSRFCGFDSFEGLPEDWDSLRPKGTFDVMGAIPKYDDPRVTLHQGWFSDTLPKFTFPQHERLVVHLDADLYSSTLFVLKSLQILIRPGTIIMFDQFCDRLHELRAWSEFLNETHIKCRLIAATINLEQVAFECTD